MQKVSQIFGIVQQKKEIIFVAMLKLIFLTALASGQLPMPPGTFTPILSPRDTEHRASLGAPMGSAPQVTENQVIMLTAVSASLTVPNFSFESPVTPSVSPGITSWVKSPQPSDFDTNSFPPWDTLMGVLANPPPPNHVDNATGNQLGYIFAYPGAGISQVLSDKYKVGQSYTLKAGVTSTAAQPVVQGSTLTLVLLYGTNVAGSTTVTYDTNVFLGNIHLIDFQAMIPEVKASDPMLGQNIGIQFSVPYSLISTAGVWHLDNVRLTEGVPIRLINPEYSAGEFSFTIQSDPGLVFDIQAVTNLNQPVWVTIGSMTNTTGTNSFMDSSGIPRFHRARITP